MIDMEREFGTVTRPDGAVLDATRTTHPTGAVEVAARRQGSATAWRVVDQRTAATFTARSSTRRPWGTSGTTTVEESAAWLARELDRLSPDARVRITVELEG